MLLPAQIVIFAFCLYLFGLAMVIFVQPKRAERFLNVFASSARAHYTEQLLRFLVGSSFVFLSSSMWLSSVWRVFGWFLVATALGLLLIPWRWHHRFGEWAIPMAIQYLRFYALGALGLGVFVLYGITRPMFD